MVVTGTISFSNEYDTIWAVDAFVVDPLVVSRRCMGLQTGHFYAQYCRLEYYFIKLNILTLKF